MTDLKKPRLARGPDGVEREWLPVELYQLYVRGWRDGSGRGFMRKDSVDLAAYVRGFIEGRATQVAAAAAYAKEVGHTPMILRTQEE